MTMNDQEKLICQQYHERQESYGVLTFACGARLLPVVPSDLRDMVSNPPSDRKNKSGFTIAVHVEQGDQTILPTLDGTPAPCNACPKERTAGRYHWLHKDPEMGWRTRAACHARASFVEPPQNCA